MPYFRVDDEAYENAKVEKARGAFGLVTAMGSYCARRNKLTNGVVSAEAVRRHFSQRGDKRLIRQAIEVGFLHETGALCDRCVAALAAEETPEPTDGYYIHDYLLHQRSRGEIVNGRRSDAARQAAKRNRDRQMSVPLPDVSRRESRASVTPGIGVGEPSTTTEENGPIDARVNDALAVLRTAPRLSPFVEGPDAFDGVANAASAFPDGDLKAAAHEVVSWLGNPRFESTDIPRLMHTAMRKQAERAPKSAAAENGKPSFADRMRERGVHF